MICGATGTIFFVERVEQFGGPSAIGDINGDGWPDVAFDLSKPRITRPYTGHDFSGDQFDGEPTGESFGSAVAFGDFNGDGVVDYAIGDPGDDTTSVDAGRVRLVDGATGAVLRTLGGLSAGISGWSF